MLNVSGGSSPADTNDGVAVGAAVGVAVGGAGVLIGAVVGAIEDTAATIVSGVGRAALGGVLHAASTTHANK